MVVEVVARIEQSSALDGSNGASRSTYRQGAPDRSENWHVAIRRIPGSRRFVFGVFSLRDMGLPGVGAGYMLQSVWVTLQAKGRAASRSVQIAWRRHRFAVTEISNERPIPGKGRKIPVAK
jgi:hypothetical protein